MSPVRIFVYGFAGLLVGEGITLWQQDAGPWLTAALSVLAGSIPLVIDYLKSSTGERAQRVRTGGARADDASRPKSHGSGLGIGGLVAGLLVLVLIGGGLAYGVSYGIGLLTGNEAITAQRLSVPASGRAGPLTVSVESVAITDHYTKLTLTAVNTSTTPVTITLFGNCQLIDQSGSTLDPTMSISEGKPIDVPANAVPIRTVVTFGGNPADAATTLTLNISTLYWHGFGPDSLQVRGIKLAAAGP